MLFRASEREGARENESTNNWLPPTPIWPGLRWNLRAKLSALWLWIEPKTLRCQHSNQGVTPAWAIPGVSHRLLNGSRFFIHHNELDTKNHVPCSAASLAKVFSVFNHLFDHYLLNTSWGLSIVFGPEKYRGEQKSTCLWWNFHFKEGGDNSNKMQNNISLTKC